MLGERRSSGLARLIPRARHAPQILRHPPVLQHDHPSRRGDRLRPVGDDHAGDVRAGGSPRSPRARARRRARWSPRRGTGTSAACRAPAPAGCAAAARRTGSCPCRRPACASPSASPRSRRATAATRAHCSAHAVSASASKKVMLSTIEPAKSWSSCITVPIMSRQARKPDLLQVDAADPDLARPAARGCRACSFSSVVLPQPDGPTIATDSPGSMRRLSRRSTGSSAAE